MGRPVKESAIFGERASMRMRLSSAIRLFDFDESAVFFRLIVDCVFAFFSLVIFFSDLGVRSCPGNLFSVMKGAFFISWFLLLLPDYVSIDVKIDERFQAANPNRHSTE